MIKFHKGLNFSVFTHFNKVKNIDICYNYANFSKKSLFLGMANGPLRISVLDLIPPATLKNVKSLLPVRQQIFEIVA